MEKKYKYITIKLVEKKPKTNNYVVINNNSEIILGVIMWNGGWRQYCFFPSGNIILSVGCMNDIIDFIKNIKK